MYRLNQILVTLACDDQGRYKDAEPLYRRAFAIRGKALGPDHPYKKGENPDSQMALGLGAGNP